LFNKNKKSELRQPKIYKSGPEKESAVWPLFIKIAVGVLLLIIILFYCIFLSPWFKINNIEIVGSPPDQVKNEINTLYGKNIFSFSSEKTKNKLLENRNYSDIKIYRGIPDTLKIIFEDRKAEIVWETGLKKYLVDEKAILYKEDDITDDQLPHVVDTSNLNVEISSQISSVDFISFIKLAKSNLNQSGFNILNFEVAETTFQVSAVTDNKIKIIFNTLRPLSEQIDALNKIYDQNKSDIKDYIDLRVEGRVYYK
jgi:cell division septal protein FtsQ